MFLLSKYAIVFCLCLVAFTPGQGICAQGPKIDPAAMQKHMEEMKRKNPVKYQAMVQKAGGTITTCTDCHKLK